MTVPSYTISKFAVQTDGAGEFGNRIMFHYKPDSAVDNSCKMAERFVCSSIVLMPVIS